jgi:enoyl-CoA hydratase/carnithine racemase
VTLPRAVGPQRAQDLLLTGRSVSGEEAAGIGLCDAVADDPRKAAVKLATAIAASAPLSVLSIRATLRRPLVAEVSAALDLEADAQAALLDTADFAEGIAASIGKRPPQFVGS